MYQISNKGRIKSLDRYVKNSKKGNRLIREKVLNPTDNGHGYKIIGLMHKGKRKNHYIHRLVAEAFIPNPEHYPQVNHKDEDKSNNSVENLEWCTPKYNMNYGRMAKIRHTLIDYSKPIYRENALRNVEAMKRPVDQIHDGVVIASYESGKAASIETGVNHSHILEVCGGKRKTAGGYIWQYRREG